MRPASTRRVSRQLRFLGLTLAALTSLVLLHAASLHGPAGVQADGRALAAAQGGLLDQVPTATNCINQQGTLPPTPIPNATIRPTANAGGPYVTTLGQPILFVGTGTPSRLSSIVTCVWNFGDGTAPSFFLSSTHTYAFAGVFPVSLTITDTSGASTTATTTATVKPSPPLCQQPNVTGQAGAVPCITGATCLTTSLNNGCRPVCAQTGEILVPGNCPGPSTGNQITINGPFQLQVEQPFTVSANINLPATSDLLVGDSIQFDFGDRQIVVNNPPSGQVNTQANTTVTHTRDSQGNPIDVTTVNVAGTAAVTSPFPASTTAQHAYTQAGTYTISVKITFKNLTFSVAQTTATVTGGAAAVITAPSPAPALRTVSLAPGCNSLTISFPDGTPVTAIVAAVQGTIVTAIYELPTNAPVLGFFPSPDAPSNLASVRKGDTAFICVTDAGILTEPSS